MKMTLGAVSSVGLLVISGCAATYSVPRGTPTASLVTYMDNDSTDTTLRTFWASTTKDGTCADSTRLISTLSPGAEYRSTPVPIEADHSFFISAHYGDARYKQNRNCTGMLAFVPQANHQYQVELVVRNNVNDCRIGIYDITSGVKEKVPFELPKNACMDTQIVTNGRPLWTNYSVHVQLVPIKR